MSFKFKKLAITPRQARIYLFFALLLLAGPTILYKLLPSHAGKILVAAGASQDYNFAKTLVYMTEHHGYGATGFILNKPLDQASILSLQPLFPFARIDQFYFGGPVSTNDEIFFMIPEDSTLEEIEILSVRDLQQNDTARYNALLQDKSAMENLRILSGYAGWHGFQLNREIVFGGWDVLPYSGYFIQDTTQEESWKRAVAKVLEDKKLAVDAL